MTTRHSITDPNNVVDLLFSVPQGSLSKEEPSNFDSYVGPIQVVVNSSSSQQGDAAAAAAGVVEGRGVVATRDITAGELLFVTPPTVEANVMDVYQEWQRQRGQNDANNNNDDNNTITEQGCLETCAERILIQAMQQACETQPHVAASFACLAGSPLVHNNDSTTETPPELDILLGKKSSSSLDVTAFTRDDLLAIIRANAFGPDGLHSYNFVESQWLQMESNKNKDARDTNDALSPQDSRIAPRLLGIYPLAAMINHSCQANAVRVYAPNRCMVVHALTDISAGTEIVWPYVPPSQPHRRPILLEQHGFICSCRRCQLEADVESSFFGKLPDMFGQDAWQQWQTWNQPRIQNKSADVSVLYPQLHRLIQQFENDILTSPALSNEVRRFLRIGYLHVYIHYFNAALMHIQIQQQQYANDPLVTGILQSDLLTLATHLHFSFCACHNASTEHLSVRI